MRVNARYCRVNHPAWRQMATNLLPVRAQTCEIRISHEEENLGKSVICGKFEQLGGRLGNHSQYGRRVKGD